MLTLFTTLRPDVGEFGRLQRNALESWTRLQPRCEVLVLGDEPGAGELATAVGATFVPEVPRTDRGTPRVDGLFATAAQVGSHELMCYVNADIILMDDFLSALHGAAGSDQRFLMIGRRWDLDLVDRLEFEAGWEERLRETVRRSGKLHPVTGIDYFAFRRGTWGEIPPFAVGRTRWDQWLVFEARRRGARVVDATPATMVVHQNHDYGHAPGGHEEVWKGAEAIRNAELAGPEERAFSIADATHHLTPSGLRTTWDAAHFRRRVEALAIVRPHLRGPLTAALFLIDRSFGLRSRFGLTLSQKRRRDS